MRLYPATQPTLYFIGVTTAQSSIMKIFPLWAKELGLCDAVIKGIDLPLHAPRESYREVVSFVKDDPLSLGALVTTHKLDLYAAAKDLLDHVDPYAEKLSEVSCLSKSGGLFSAHAKDPVSCGLALEMFLPENNWQEHGGEALLLGAGGSALAMSLYFSKLDHPPRRITIANRSTPRLHSAQAALTGLDLELVFAHGPSPEDNDALIKKLPPYSLIVNATGLGKDAPGSPTTDAAAYPAHSFVWEINYRGDLIFMEQAGRQKTEKKLHVEDGWQYFIHGWTQVISEVFHIEIEGDLLARLSEIANFARG